MTKANLCRTFSQLSEAEGAQQAALQELRELREANEDFRAREAVFERLTEEMNDAMAKWKEVPPPPNGGAP